CAVVPVVQEQPLALEVAGLVEAFSTPEGLSVTPLPLCARDGPAPEDQLWGAGRWCQSLRVPLADRKSNWLGLALVADPSQPQAELAAELLAVEAGLLLENLR